jgi:uncharacterized protein HemX
METAPQTEITPETSGWRAALRRPAVRVGLVALAIIVAQWVDTRMQVASLQQELARRLADSEPWPGPGEARHGTMQESLAAQQAKISVLEARLAETQSQAVALEAMYQELSSSRDERLLAEVEQAVVIAMQQLQFSGNVEAALIALQGAEARLARSLQPQFLPVRKLIARDIERLKGIPGANISGLSLKIESVVTAVDGLPLAFEQRPKPVAPKAGADAKPVNLPTSGASWARTCGANSANWCASSASIMAIRPCWRRSRAISCARTSSCGCSTRALRCCSATAVSIAKKSARRASSSIAISTAAPSRCRPRNRHWHTWRRPTSASICRAWRNR